MNTFSKLRPEWEGERLVGEAITAGAKFSNETHGTHRVVACDVVGNLFQVPIRQSGKDTVRHAD